MPRFDEHEGLAALMDRAIEEFGLAGTMPPEVLQFPTEENKQTAIVRVGLICEGKEGAGQRRTYYALGDACPDNTTSSDVKKRPVAMAESRAWVRALRMLTNTYGDRVDGRQPPPPPPARDRPSPQPAAAPKAITREQWDTIVGLGAKLGLTEEQTAAKVKAALNVAAVKDATEEQAARIVTGWGKELTLRQAAPAQPALPEEGPPDEGPPPEPPRSEPEERDRLRRDINKQLPRLVAVGSTMKPPGPQASVAEMRGWLVAAEKALA